MHADPATAELADLIRDMSARTTTGYLFGGLASARSKAVHIANEVLAGGLSGVAFSPAVDVVSRVTQGCQPFGPLRKVSAVDANVVTALDGEPALDCLLRDLKLDAVEPREALPRLRETLVGLSDPNDTLADGATSARRGAFGSETRVRHLIGLDVARRGIAIGDIAEPGMRLAFCSRNAAAARRDLMRICAEIREETEPEALPLATAEALKNAGPGEPAPRADRHRRRDLRQLRGPRRAALRRAVGRAGDRPPRARRRAAGRLLRGRRDRPPPRLRLHRRADGVPQRALTGQSR